MKRKSYGAGQVTEEFEEDRYPKQLERLLIEAGALEAGVVSENLANVNLHKFEDLIVWQKARLLTKEIYQVTSRTASGMDFGLADQMRGSSVSIMSNIAEGQGRSGVALFIQFLSHAAGSSAELRSQLYVALDAEFITEDKFVSLSAQVLAVSRMVHGLSESLKRSRKPS
ncbi:MAG TPA: four helix bundle protein [Fimbriimonadaceae bacterium]|jgi:four helix bundle protein